MGLKIFALYDKNKSGQSLNGHMIIDIHAVKGLIDENRTILIISSTKYADEILQDLEDAGICAYGAYTYGGLKIAVELNIRSEKMDEWFRRTFSWRLEEQERNQKYRATDDVMRQWLPNLLLKHDCGVLIFQSGKVGSSSIAHSFRLIGFPVVHIHNFSSSQNFKQYLQEKKETVKIITAVREPIARAISQYFQALGGNRLADWNDGRAVPDLCSGVRKQLLMSCELEQGKYPYVNNEFVWFDVHMKDLTGIDIFQYPFDREKGYGLIKEGKWEILVLKTERLNENTEVIGDFVGVKDFKLVNHNVGSEKLYKYLYADVKEELIIPREVIDYYYNGNERMDHFYTEKQKAEMKARYRLE